MVTGVRIGEGLGAWGPFRDWGLVFSRTWSMKSPSRGTRTRSCRSTTIGCRGVRSGGSSCTPSCLLLRRSSSPLQPRLPPLPILPCIGRFHPSGRLDVLETEEKVMVSFLFSVSRTILAYTPALLQELKRRWMTGKALGPVILSCQIVLMYHNPETVAGVQKKFTFV